MQISSQTNNYQMMQQYQQPIQPSTKPIEPDDSYSFDPIKNDAETQAKRDAQRGYATQYLAHKSKQSQIEIYLSVATDSNVELGNDTPIAINILRDIQKQNNAVQAYATYQENQKSSELDIENKPFYKE